MEAYRLVLPLAADLAGGAVTGVVIAEVGVGSPLGALNPKKLPFSKPSS
jgi:hypothetical protein